MHEYVVTVRADHVVRDHRVWAASVREAVVVVLDDHYGGRGAVLLVRGVSRSSS